MSKAIEIKKGLNIPLVGQASDRISVDTKTELYAITPDDFPGFTWKAIVKPGDHVAVGAPLMRAKEDEALCLTAMTAGIVQEIKRGERRKIEFISVKKSAEQNQLTFNIEKAADNILRTLKESGLFAFLRQRPFDVVPNPNVAPRDIFISAFDSAPLAPQLSKDEIFKYLENGVEMLSKLTNGKIYVSIDAHTSFESKVAEVVKLSGPHPAGNVGVQIANIKPINKGETVWTLDAITASRIGKLFETGTLDFSTLVAITGEDAADPHYVRTTIGASLSSLLEGEVITKENSIRVISGNVLTGHKVLPESGFLRLPYRQVSLIDEGDNADEFMGWASLSPKKYSVKRTFPAFLRGLSKPFSFDARIKGGHRAMILSGEYDKVFPFDIYPEYLIKAILANDIDKMEQLGIYEVAPEDFALPEFVDTSKLELQKIVRDGLAFLRKETL